MKKSVIIFISLGILLVGCPWEDKCKDAFELADLVVNTVEQFTSEEDNEKVYNIIHTVLNSTKKVSCSDAVENAGSHDSEIPIEYSEDGDFNTNAEEVLSKTFNANSLPAGETYQAISKIVFAVDGVYRILANLDVNDDVKERNENNNQSVDGITGLKSSNINPRTIIIHVTNTGNFVPEIDENGNPIYIKKWDLKLVQ